jgi:hypothetical protein
VVDTERQQPEGLTFTAQLGPARAWIAMARRSDTTWELSGELRSEAERAVELARFHYLDGPLARKVNLLAPTEHQFFNLLAGKLGSALW